MQSKRPLYKRYARYRLEIFSAFTVITWGSFLLNPFVNSFERFPNYAEMAKRASEDAWGGMAVFIGLCSLVGILWEKKHLRRFAMICVLIFRTFTMLLVGFQTHFASSGVGDFFWWAVIALVAYVRIDNEF